MLIIPVLPAENYPWEHFMLDNKLGLLWNEDPIYFEVFTMSIWPSLPFKRLWFVVGRTNFFVRPS